MPRAVAVVSLLLAVVFLVAACAEDPTPTPVPTATPVPTNTPEPPTPTPVPEPVMSSDPFVFAAGTTGEDLLSWVSAEEDACVRAAVGDQMYNSLVMSMDLSPSSPALTSQGLSQAGAFFACFSPENLAATGAGIYAAKANANGKDPEVVTCISDMLSEHPEFTYIQLGLEDPTGETHVTHGVVSQAFVCFPEETLDIFWSRNQQGFTSGGPTLGEAVDVVSGEADTACLNAAGPAAMGVPAVTAFKASEGALNGCISDDGAVELYFAVLETTHGQTLPDDAKGCLSALFEDHNHFPRAFIGLTEPGQDGVDSLELLADLTASQTCPNVPVLRTITDPIFFLANIG